MLRPSSPFPSALRCSFILWLTIAINLGLPRSNTGQASAVRRTCIERIWPDFQRCRERQMEYARYGRYSSLSFLSWQNTDAYQSKYKLECCSYWDLVDCVHRAAKVYCSDDVDLKRMYAKLEQFGLNIPLYVCTEEYPKGSIKCRIPSWIIISTLVGIVMALGFCACTISCWRVFCMKPPPAPTTRILMNST